MKDDITYVAMDAHKKVHSVLMEVPGKEQVEWTVRNTEREIKRMVKRILKAAPSQILMCYEAGPCGFSIQRRVESKRLKCVVIAPSLIPNAAGDRVKTDRRDTRKLLRLLKAGLLTTVAPPTEEEEAVRDVCRCHDAARKDLMRARHRLLKLLSRHAMVYTDGKHWTKKHHAWLRHLEFDNPKWTLVFTEYLMEVERQEERVKRLESELEKISEEEPYREPVGYLRCFRGVGTVAAVKLFAEIYGILRFPSPRELMSYLGMTSSEDSSGERRRQGPITKAGNRYARRVLVEVAWHYRHRPAVGTGMKARREGQPPWVISVADRAQRRLNRRFNMLIRNGKKNNVALTAIARELVGFIWSVLHTRAADREAVRKNCVST